MIKEAITTSNNFDISNQNERKNLLLPAIARDEILLEEELGRGSCGVVHKGKCRHVPVAVKEINAIEGDEEHSRFWQEVSIMLQIRHPNVVNIMGACTGPKNCLIVTEFLPNKDLQEMLDKHREANKEIDPIYALKLAHDIASGMHWLHCSLPPIIHRDLKPANVLIDQYNNAKIADFGLSIVNQEKEKQEKKLTGSPLWMAPEALEMKPVNEKIDIYAFSIILYQLLTTTPVPYDLSGFKKNFHKFLTAITVQKMRPTIPPSLPPALANLISIGWDHEPEKRPTFGQILTQLGEIRSSMVLRSDATAISLWFKYFNHADKVKVEAFCKAVYDTLGETCPDPSNPKDELQLQKYKSLAAIAKDDTVFMIEQNKNDKHNYTSLSRFGLLLAWFGPLQKSSSTAPGFLERVYSTMREPWFHGDISRDTAVSLLTTASETNLSGWLVRTSDVSSSPYTLSRIIQNKDKKPECNHMRIGFNQNINKYHLEVKASKPKDRKSQSPSAGGTVKIEGFLLSEIIAQSAGSLNLKKKHIVPRQYYNDIFVMPKVQIVDTSGYSGEGTPTNQK